MYLIPKTSQAESVTGVGRVPAAPKTMSTVPFAKGFVEPTQFPPVLQLSVSPRPCQTTGAGTGTISPLASRAAPVENVLNVIAFRKSAGGGTLIKIRSSVPLLAAVPSQPMMVRVPLPVRAPAANVSVALGHKSAG